jgi:competence protein ComEC
MAIGDASRLSPALKDQMQQLSLTHLVAVSGANCAIVCALVVAVLAGLGASRLTRMLAAGAALLAYLGLVGPQPSVLRAATMAICVLVARGLGRATSALDGLALAILILVVAEPSQSVNLGFELSGAATLGILVLAPALAQRFARRMPRWLALAASVSVSAQLLCTPLLLGLQGGLPVWSLLANLLAEPMVAPSTILGMLAVLLAIPAPHLAASLCWVASLFAAWTVSVAGFCSGLPMQLIPWPSGFAGQVAIMGAVFSAWLLMRKRQSHHGVALARVSALAPAGLVLALVVPALIGVRHNLVAARWPARDWQIANCDVGQGDALVVRSRKQVMVIDVGREPEPVDRCLDQLGIEHIDVLELTHFDLDHVGGVSGALDGRVVDRALLTSFADSRPGADDTRQILEARGIPTNQVGIGVSGTLGDFRWRVITPTIGASEAEDSNDGSIGMLFKSDRLCLVTLADLGAAGQERLLASSSSWFDDACRTKPLVLKVAHHGSANQSAEFIDWLRPQLAMVSVGLNNRYGHPTDACLNVLERIGAQILRTDRMGGIALSITDGNLGITVAGRG